MGDGYKRIPLRTVRVDDDLWADAREVAEQRGDSLSDVIRAALRRYIARQKA